MADKFVRIKTSTNNYVWVKEGSVTPEELDVVKNNLTNEIKVVSDSLKDYAKIEDLNDVAEQSKEYTDNQIKTIRENHFIIIDELPTPSKDYVGNIYLVSNPDDTYGEYIIIDDNGEYKWEAIGTTQISDDFRVDDALSDTSINPVQNKVIKEALNKTVTTDTDQTISGSKTFTGEILASYNFGDVHIYNEENENGYEEPVIYFNGPFGRTKYKRNTIINNKGSYDDQTFTFPEEGGTLATEEQLEDALSGYVPEFPNMSQYNKDYLVSYNANTKKSTPISYTNAGDGSKPAAAWAVSRTGEGGVLTVGTPTGDYHATPKVYVDKGMWLPAYDATVTYAKDVMVTKEGKIYKSLIDNNIGNLGNAETEATSWEDLLSGKVDKKTTAVGYSYVYGYTGPNQTVYRTSSGLSSVPTGYSHIASYVPNTDYSNAIYVDRSVIVTGTPKHPAHCANKAYVDEQIASVKKYYRHTITFSTNDSDGNSTPLHYIIRLTNSSPNSINTLELLQQEIETAEAFIYYDCIECDARTILAPKIRSFFIVEEGHTNSFRDAGFYVYTDRKWENENIVETNDINTPTLLIINGRLYDDIKEL